MLGLYGRGDAVDGGEPSALVQLLGRPLEDWRFTHGQWDRPHFSQRHRTPGFGGEAVEIMLGMVVVLRTLVRAGVVHVLLLRGRAGSQVLAGPAPGSRSASHPTGHVAGVRTTSADP